MKRLAHRRGFSAAALLLAVVAVGTISSSSALTKFNTGPQAQSRGQQRHRAATAGIEAAASVTGSFADSVSYPDGGGPATLEELADLTRLVVIGRLETNFCALSGDGRSIITYFTLRVESVLSGEFRGDLLTIPISGGRVVFPNGNWAQLNVSNFLMPPNGNRILVFLRPAPEEMVDGNGAIVAKGGGVAFVPTAGPLGLYNLDLSQSRRSIVLPAGSHQNPMARLIYKAKLTPDEFVARVRTLLSARGSSGRN